MQIIVIYVLIIVLYGIIKKVNAYDAFMKGVENSFKTVKAIFPNILGIIFAINVFTESGIIEIIKDIFKNVNMVPELIVQCFLKPISWSSSLLFMNNIFSTYGVDSFVGKLATLIQGGSDTTIYVVALYFSSIKMKKTSHTMIVGILTDICVFLLCALFSVLFLKS